jgi:hypothetical protein
LLKAPSVSAAPAERLPRSITNGSERGEARQLQSEEADITDVVDNRIPLRNAEFEAIRLWTGAISTSSVFQSTCCTTSPSSPAKRRELHHQLASGLDLQFPFPAEDVHDVANIREKAWPRSEFPPQI